MARGRIATTNPTCRAQQARLLLLPSAELNDILLGVLGRAQRLYPVRLCGYVFLSNHFHLLLDVDDAQQLALFMGYFNSNLAREIARRTDWEDKVWGRRYQAIVVSEEEAAQVARLEYLLSHGCKELVERLADWPASTALPPCSPAIRSRAPGSTARRSGAPASAGSSSNHGSTP